MGVPSKNLYLALQHHHWLSILYTVLCIVAVNGEPEGASTSMASEGASPLITVSEGAPKLLFHHLRGRSDLSIWIPVILVPTVDRFDNKINSMREGV
jgi:hypothetical protein